MITVITGPRASGKTTLATALAQFYTIKGKDCIIVDEFNPDDSTGMVLIDHVHPRWSKPTALDMKTIRALYSYIIVCIKPGTTEVTELAGKKIDFRICLQSNIKVETYAS